MDAQNESEPEIFTDNSRTTLEAGDCSMQKPCENESNSKDTLLKEPIVQENPPPPLDQNRSELVLTGKDNSSHITAAGDSPPSNVDTNQIHENFVKGHETSPHSGDSEGSFNVISLQNDAEGDVEKESKNFQAQEVTEGSDVIKDVSEKTVCVSTDNSVEENIQHDGNSVTKQEDINESESSPTQEVVGGTLQYDGNGQGEGETNNSNSSLFPPDGKGTVECSESGIVNSKDASDKNEIDLESPKEDMEVGSESEKHETIEKPEDASGSLLSTMSNAISESKSEEEIVSDNGPSDSYRFDTSIFPGRPVDQDKVVAANCFEVDGTKDTELLSLGESTPSGNSVPVGNDAINFPTSTKTSIEACSAPPGPSDDREEISDDEEFDVESSGRPGTAQDESISQDNAGRMKHLYPDKSDNGSVNSSDVGEIIDLKLEDAALKSLGSSCDTEDNRQSKVSNEDLEAVSDDELPNVPQAPDAVAASHRPSLLEDREEVSSSEDEELAAQPNSDMLPISSGDEFSNQLKSDGAKDGAVQSQGVEPTEAGSLSRLESLEAEPISDEEDNTMANDESKQTSFDDGEAGEIKSPALGSPISEQGDLMLGEVEPVSADESADTDGELPSGDEAEKEDGKGDKKFESIDSDDDDDLIGEGQKSNQGSSNRHEWEKSSSVASEGRKKDKGEYMETISDEDNLEGEESVKKRVDSSDEKPASLLRKESPLDKGRIQPSFNEHQLELDYEEAYGDDGEAKTDMKDEQTKEDLKDDDKEEGEDNDEDQGLASDKDEGELSDDDCEEGEIKEPGMRKMFVKPVCRFFQRGNCTWGINCRFLHPGVNDKGNYQMIEIPGFKPGGIRARLGVQGQWTEQQPPPEEEVELPPPPVPDVPHVETAWERGLRIAKEQRKKASERKEKEPDFEEKRLNLSVDEDRELNKENERTPKIIPKDPYYDQQAYEVDEYYKIPRDPWHLGHPGHPGQYENFEVRYQQGKSYSPPYSPPYREKPPAPPMRYTRPLSPPIDKFGRHRDVRPEPERHEPLRVSDYPPPPKHPDEWIDPWRRSKSPKQRKPRSRSRGRRNRRSVSDSSDSSRSSRSSSGSSRSSRSGSGSSGSSSRSRSPEPAPPGVDRMDRPERYGNDQPRSTVSVRGPQGQRDGHHRYDNARFDRPNRMYNNNNDRNMYKPRQDSNFYPGHRGGGGGGYYPNNNYRGFGGGRDGGFGGRDGGFGGGGPGPYNNRDPRNRDSRYTRNMSPARGGRGGTPDRPLPYTRPRQKSRSSSRSSSSRSRSRSRSKSSDSSRSRSSSNSSRSSSSSSSSGGSADSDHLYRDLGSPSKNPRHPSGGGGQKKRMGDSRKDRGSTKDMPGQPGSRHPPTASNPDRIPHPRSPTHSRGDPKYSQIPLPPPGGRSDSKYASRNAPQPPVKAKDPLKVVGQKSNIKLTLLPKQQQQSNLGDRPNPLASPPHKRRISERDSSPPPAPPPKRLNVPMQPSGLKLASEKAAKINMRQEKAKSPPAGSLPPPTSSSASQRSKNPPIPTSPQKQPASKTRPSADPASTKTAPKAPSGGSGSSNASGSKSKKSMSSRREELLKQLKAVEDAIARKKFKMS